MADLDNMYAGFVSVTSLTTAITVGQPLPDLLPTLYLDLVTISTIERTTNVFGVMLNSQGNNKLWRDVQDFVDLNKSYLRQVVSWYQLLMQQQNADMQRMIMAQRGSELEAIVHENQIEALVVEQAQQALNQLRSSAQYRVLVGM